jgi:hypothetical protein
MSIRKTRLATIVLVLFAACSVVTFSRAPRRAPEPPRLDLAADWGMPELLARLREQRVELHPAPVGRVGELSAGAFLSEAPLTWEQRARLARARERARDWRGVVLALPTPPSTDDGFELQLREWKEYSLVAGGVVLFGDPELLARIAEALR